MLDAGSRAGVRRDLHRADRRRRERSARSRRRSAGRRRRVVLHHDWRRPTAAACGPRRTCPRTRPRTTPSAVELGVKFRADQPGFVTGIRFYKGAGNTGTHVGNLWTSDGTLLATATFTGETADRLAAGELRDARRRSRRTPRTSPPTTRRTAHYAADAGFFSRGRRRRAAAAPAPGRRRRTETGCYATARPARSRTARSTPPTTGSTSCSPPRTRRRSASLPRTRSSRRTAASAVAASEWDVVGHRRSQHPGLRHRHQREPRRHGDVQDRHDRHRLRPRHLPARLLRRPRRALRRPRWRRRSRCRRSSRPAATRSSTGLDRLRQLEPLGLVDRARRRDLGHLCREGDSHRHGWRESHRLHRERRRE